MWCVLLTVPLVAVLMACGGPGPDPLRQDVLRLEGQIAALTEEVAALAAAVEIDRADRTPPDWSDVQSAAPGLLRLNRCLSDRFLVNADVIPSGMDPGVVMDAFFEGFEDSFGELSPEDHLVALRVLGVLFDC